MSANWTTQAALAQGFARSYSLPVADPGNASSKYQATAPIVASAWSQTVVPLSTASDGAGGTIISDATGGVLAGAAPPAGATGQEVAINAFLAAVSNNGSIPSCVVWDLAVANGASIYVQSQQTIIFPSKACGIILRAGANCCPIRIKGSDANMSISANTQKTFGAQNPAHPADQRYRIIANGIFNAFGVRIIGGTINGNSGGQSTQMTSAQGWLVGVQMFGVDNLLLWDIDVVGSPGYGFHVANVRNLNYGVLRTDALSAGTNFGRDGMHCNGPLTIVRGGSFMVHTDDDALAFCADDGITPGGIVIAGTNWPCSGDITDVKAEAPSPWPGTENVVSAGVLRLISTASRMDDLHITATHGVTQFYGLQSSFSPMILDGPGNYGHIIFDNASHDLTNPVSGWRPFFIDKNWEFLEIRNRYRYNAQALPDIAIQSTATLAKLHIEWNGYQPAGAANNSEPAVMCAGTIGELKIKGTMTADSSITGRTAPFLLTATGANIGLAILDVHGDQVTNLVDHQAGTLTTLIMSGLHSNAGGGSPVNVSSGLTIANAIYPALVWKTGTAFKSGLGAITTSSASGNAYTGP